MRHAHRYDGYMVGVKKLSVRCRLERYVPGVSW